jgi:HD-like signal output (HDOD) protein
MSNEKLEGLRPKIEALEAVPTIPAIVQPLARMLRLPPDQVDLERVVELVSYDSTIAAQCLRMANSPLFGRRNTETVRSAVMALGLKRVEAILLGCCLSRIVPPHKWVFDALTFWRHSLGCALASQKMARLIGYPEPDKAYLAGLLHDLGVLVNTLVCTEPFRECFRSASEGRTVLHQREREILGFDHCQSGRLLAEHWRLPKDLVEVIAWHHDIAAAESAPSLVSLVHLSDLLCRLRDLGYGYYEAIGVDLAGEKAWETLVQYHPALATIDLARLSLDIDGAMDEITRTVDAVFRPQAG